MEELVEEEHVVLQRVSPVVPVVYARALVEIVRDVCLHELVVQGAVDAVKEVLGAAVEDYLQQQQYAAEEAKFINKMNEFGAKFGLSEKELVTFGNAAMEKGINIANVTDIEAVFRVIYPEQYAIRVQRMSNAPTSQIYGGASTPENPRVSVNKLEDAYVEQFMKNSMPNAYFQKKY